MSKFGTKRCILGLLYETKGTFEIQTKAQLKYNSGTYGTRKGAKVFSVKGYFCASVFF